MINPKQLVLIILDGFGVATDATNNPILAASPRNLNFIINHYPAITLQASGPSVGLPWGERGNSEVGHLNLGAGRMISEDLTRINSSIASGDFAQNPAFLAAMAHVKENRSRLHLAGLLSPGGVHSSEEHLFALMDLAAKQGISDVYIHAFADGRDTNPKAIMESIDRLTRRIMEIGVGKVATICGRFYAMDRGKHWELTEKTYRCLTLGEGNKYQSTAAAINDYYEQQTFDETIPPTVITGPDGEPIAKIADNDAVIFFNFRQDRMRQLVECFSTPGFEHFAEKYPELKNIFFVTMTAYDKVTPSVSVAYPPLEIHNGLTETISLASLSQYHTAESEKYAHVTYFFNGGREEPWPLEDRKIVLSPASYQENYQNVPEMKVKEVGQGVIEQIRAGTNFILANIANPDMVGHTGNRAACIAAIKAVDETLGEIFAEVVASGAYMVITADHGNIEEVTDTRFGNINKKHSLNPVPFIVIGPGWERKKIKLGGYEELVLSVPEGILSDVSPTVLELMDISIPPEMTSVSLVERLKKVAFEGDSK